MLASTRTAIRVLIMSYAVGKEKRTRQAVDKAAPLYPKFPLTILQHATSGEPQIFQCLHCARKDPNWNLEPAIRP
jgi:hypothetical protein